MILFEIFHMICNRIVGEGLAEAYACVVGSLIV